MKLYKSKYWLAQKDPRRSAMFISSRLFYAFMTLTYVISWFVSGIQEISNHMFFLYMWLLYSAHFFLLTMRASWAIKENGVVDEKMEEKNTNRFPGWVLVLFIWIGSWSYALLLLYYEAWLDKELVFDYKIIFIVLVVSTGFFNITDSARARLAQNLTASFGDMLESIFQRFGKILRAIIGKNNIPE